MNEVSCPAEQVESLLSGALQIGYGPCNQTNWNDDTPCEVVVHAESERFRRDGCAQSG